MFIPYYLQYFYEKKVNAKYEWLVYGLSLASLLLYGVLFHWIPRYFRSKRDSSIRKRSFYFKILKIWDIFNSSFRINLPFGKFIYVQPSIGVLGIVYFAINGIFCFVDTEEINYEPRYYIVGKRMGRISSGNLPFLYLLLAKNDLLMAITGLSQDKLVFLHKWIGRNVWLLATTHLILCVYYWLDLGFPVMLQIPPEIFGMIAYASCFFLTFASPSFIRKLAYEFFLIQHRVFGAIMLLFILFHNPGNKATAILAIHSLVIDRILTLGVQIYRRRKEPSIRLSRFKLLDDDTVEVTIPFKSEISNRKWWHRFLPSCFTWSPGQHVYLNVKKISFLQYHPFTIASVTESREMKLVIRKKGGFTKKLVKFLKEKKESDIEAFNQDELSEIELKIQIKGPYGGKFQPLITFDSLLFIAGGTGASFTFPIAIDLIRTIQRRDDEGDYFGRAKSNQIHIVWAIKKEQNMNWYEESLKELKKYAEDGFITMDIYVTSEPKIVETIQVEGVVSKSESITEKSKTESYFGEYLSVTDLDSSSSGSYVKKLYKKLDTKNLIDQEVCKISGLQNGSSMSLAVVNCGAPELTRKISTECHSNRYRKNAPDIYCLTEVY